MSAFKLTSYNNPYNPFTDFVNWNVYDNRELNLGTIAWLGRITYLSDSMTDEEEDKECERAMDVIVNLLPNLYVKVTENDYEFVDNCWKLKLKPPSPSE